MQEAEWIQVKEGEKETEKIVPGIGQTSKAIWYNFKRWISGSYTHLP